MRDDRLYDHAGVTVHAFLSQPVYAHTQTDGRGQVPRTQPINHRRHLAPSKLERGNGP